MEKQNEGFYQAPHFAFIIWQAIAGREILVIVYPFTAIGPRKLK